VLPPPRRDDGYAPIRDYAAIGDGRTVALVARDGSIDWLPFPSIDTPTVFGALLDARRGGSFTLAPASPYSVSRRYLPGTNILETTFVTETGAASVTDAMAVPAGTGPFQRADPRDQGLGKRFLSVGSSSHASATGTPGCGLAGARSPSRGRWRGRRRHLHLRSRSAGARVRIGLRPIRDRGGRKRAHRSVLRPSGATGVPVTFRDRGAVGGNRCVVASLDRVRDPPGAVAGGGREEFFAPSGAVAAAPTTSLPEEIGGERNWDYRLSWVRDSAFTLDALLRVGCSEEAEAFFWWLMQASQLTHRRLQVLYRMDGGADAPERTLELQGYRDSRPVRVGNAAAGQLQLEIYGSLFETAWLLSEAGHRIDQDVAKRLAETADLVCEIWPFPDSGIWEVRSEPKRFTRSKMMGWVALDRAVKLAELGRIPDRHAEQWRGAASAIRDFIEAHCWSDRLGSYIRAAGQEELDASILTGALSATATSAGSHRGHGRGHPP